MSDLLHIIITSQDGATLNTAGTYCDKDMRIHINMPVGAIPQEISTEAEMNALFETAEVGSIYKYVGETGNYEAGAYYAVESDGMAKIFKKLIPEGSGGGDIAINGIVEQYKVNAGATVNAGDFVEFVTRYGNGTFNSSSVQYVSACKLDNNRVFVAFRNSTAYGTAVVINIVNGTTTVGTPFVFNSANTFYVSAVALTDSKVLVAYNNSGLSGSAIILTIDGTNITAGTIKVFESAKTSYISAVALSDSKVLVVYRDEGASNKGTAIVLTINGTTITTGTANAFVSSSTTDTFAVALSDSKVLVVYRDASGSNDGKAIILTIGGTTITAGTAVSISDTVNSGSISAVALSDSKVLVAYRGSGAIGYAIVLTIDGITITKGTAIAFNSSSTHYISTIALTDSKVLVVYQDTANTSYGTAIVLNIDGTNITAGTEKVFDYNTVTYTSLVAFSENSALVAYNNGVGAYSGITIDGTDITADGSTLGTYVQKANTRLHNVGVAKTGGAEGETVDVYCVG